MIAKAYGAHVIAVDINEQSLKMAEKCGADYCINSLKVQDISHKIHQLSHRGAHISIDALGHKEVIMQSVYSLRKKGRHIQIGLLEKEDVKVSVPMDRIIAHELKILGSHGMQAHRYTAIWELIEQGKVEPSQLISNEVNLKDGIDILTSMELHPPEAVAVITDFS